MKNLKKAIALCLSLLLLMAFPVSASAAETEEVPSYFIDEGKTGSLTIYKYDMTNSQKDGVWDGSYVSTGIYDQTVNDTLGGDKANVLGNGDTGYGYAIPGVEFSYLRVAEIIQFSEAESEADDHVEVLYGVDRTAGADFLKAIGLNDGSKRFEKADHLDEGKYYYQSDVLVEALASSLESNATTVKNGLEAYMQSSHATAMAKTDAYGKTGAENLPLGLYLVLETAVPEQVVSTTSPFLVSLPMTSVDGTNATDGGTRWIYDVTLYPKNLTGIPTLEKTLRETKADTGKNGASDTDIADGYAHTGTASAGDVIDYQIISTLPSITSASTHLSCYTFVDTLSAGLSYAKGDVKLAFFKDAACKEPICTWAESDGKFTVSYNTTEKGESVMTIEMTDAGLTEINTAKTVYTGDSMVNSGYSDCTMRITYQAKVNTDDTVVYGDAGNPNAVVLTWQRTSNGYYDTLVDDAHIFTYGIDLTKRFSDGKGDFSKVEFLIHNDTDGYFVKAELDKESGIYYVTGHADKKADATRFVPVSSGSEKGKIVVKGLEDDTYTLSELRTASGYTLLKKGIKVVISQKETADLCNVYSKDVLGLIQNDPRYAEIIKDTGDLHNMPQKHLEHKLLTAAASIDGNKVNMKEDNASVNALVPLTVVNTKGFNLPETGDHGTVLTTVVGIIAMAGAAAVLLTVSRKKKAV